MTSTRRIAVLGAGAWGSTLADLLARNGAAVRLWDRSADALTRLDEQRCPFGVPELYLHDRVETKRDLADALADAEFAVLVVPSQAIGSACAAIAAAKGDALPIVVLASKGIDVESLRPLTDVVADALPGVHVGVLSGPCIAREVAQRVPTSVVAAANDPKVAVAIRDAFAAKHLRIYTQGDVIGVELGGALKNVVAIAAGIGDGLGFGANTKAALMTRGLAEMARLAEALGAQRSTMYGLAGLGDLAVTCFSPHSRNRTFGEHLGHGMTAEAARAAVGMTVEGEPTARAALALASRHGVEMPVTEAVCRVCAGDWTPRQAVEALMLRELKDEFPLA